MSTEDFGLDQSGPLPARLRGFYKKPRLGDYGDTYGVGERTIKRWVSAGRAAKPDPDFPPLDEPGKMAGWWRRRMSHDVPARILAAAAAGGCAAEPVSDAEPGPAVSGVDPIVAAATGTPMDLSGVYFGEGDALRWSRQLAAGVFAKLSDAFLAGIDDNIRMWQPRWEKAAETLRRAEEADRVAQEKRGKLVPREAVEADVGEAVEMLKSMRENMVRRICEQLPTLEPAQLDRVVSVILSERAKEDLVFQGMPSLRCRDDAGAILDAA